MAGVRSVVSLGVLLFTSVAALASDPATQIEVKVLSDGVAVASALLPRDANVKVTASSISRVEPSSLTGARAITTAAGHATLVATQDGRVILTLNGDQLKIAELPL